MAIVATNPEPINGPWVSGFVLDRHVVSSQPIGLVGQHTQFDTIRTPLGELVFRLKYRSGQPDDIVETAVAFVTQYWSGAVDCVVSPPPSLHRARQPAAAIADGIAAQLGVPASPTATIKVTATEPMKNVPLPERAPTLATAIQAGPDSVSGQRVLLVDDLWETGSTLRRVAQIVEEMGASEIRALVMTRTR